MISKIKALWRAFTSILQYKDHPREAVEEPLLPEPSSPNKAVKWLSDAGYPKPSFPNACPQDFSSKIRSEFLSVISHYWSSCDSKNWFIIPRSSNIVCNSEHHISFFVIQHGNSAPEARLSIGSVNPIEANPAEAIEFSRILQDILARRDFNNKWSSYASLVVELTRIGDANALSAINSVRPAPLTLEDLPYAK